MTDAVRESGPVVLVTDRRRWIPVARGLGRRVQVWGFGPAARGADRRLRETLAEPPDLPADALLWIDLEAERAVGIVRLLSEIYPRVAIALDPRTAPAGERVPRARTSDLESWFRDWLGRQQDLAAVRAKVERLRDILEPARRVLILTHPNPDPDALASALAMRSILGRNRQTATLGYVGRPLSRPENRAMVDLLEIDIERMDAERIGEFDALVLVDCQENVFGGFELPEVTAVVDHHPEQSRYTARYRDVVPEEGSTSTIMTRYLQALELEPSQRLATALLYGVKSDTLFLKREVNRDDIESFMYLYPRANVNLLRRMESPELPVTQMRQLGEALQQARLENGLFTAIVEDAESAEDLVARLADLGLQAAGAEWSLAGARVGGELVLSIRNVGYVRHAGRAAEAAFGRWGPAGGHRSAARAILPAADLADELGPDWMQQWPAWARARLEVELTPDEDA